MIIEHKRSTKEREVGVDYLYVGNRRVGHYCNHCNVGKMGWLYKLRGRISAYLISKGLFKVGGRSK